MNLMIDHNAPEKTVKLSINSDLLARGRDMQISLAGLLAACKEETFATVDFAISD